MIMILILYLDSLVCLPTRVIRVAQPNTEGMGIEYIVYTYKVLNPLPGQLGMSAHQGDQSGPAQHCRGAHTYILCTLIKSLFKSVNFKILYGPFYIFCYI